MGTTSSTLEFSAATRRFKAGPVPLDDHAAWGAFFTCHIGWPEVFREVSTEWVRHLRRHEPETLATLIFKCVEQLHLFVASHTKAPQERLSADAARVSLLVLARVLPVALEPFAKSEQIYSAGIHQAAQDNAEERSQRPPNPDPDADPEAEAAPEPVVETPGVPPPSRFAAGFARHVLFEGRACSDDDATLPDLGRPLGIAMMRALVAAATLPGFTVGANQTDDAEPRPEFPHVRPGLLWIGGIGSKVEVVISASEEIHANRTHVLRAIIAAVSGQVYEPQFCVPDPLRAVLVDPATPGAATLMASLAAILANYNPYGALAYTSHMTYMLEHVVYYSIHVLLLALDYDMFYVAAQRPREPVDDDDDEATAALPTPNPNGQRIDGVVALERHAAWGVMTALQGQEQHLFIVGLQRFLYNESYSKITYLPGSQRVLRCREEFFVLLWKLVENVESFRTGFAAHVLGRDSLVPLLDFMLRGRDAAESVGQLQLGAMLLWCLSCEREWVLQLNTDCAEWLPFALPQKFAGTYADLLLLALHHVMTCDSEWVRPVHQSCLAVAVNLSPFVTKLSPVTGGKLVNLLLRASARCEAGTESERSFELVVLALANCIQYEYNGSSAVLYALTRQADKVRAMWQAIQDGTRPLTPEVEKRLLLFTLVCAIDAALPMLEKAVRSDPHGDPLAVLQRGTLVGRLPVPHPIIIQRFVPQAHSDAWVTSWLWSLVHMSLFPKLHDPRTVQLFTVRPQPTVLMEGMRRG